MKKYITVVLITPLLALLTIACAERVDQPPPSEFWQPVDATGRILVESGPDEHACVFDRRTGLMWQAHRDIGGLHDSGNRYSWYSTDEQRHMSEPGLADGGACAGSGCDTQALVEAINQEGLCGHGDWRMPTREELLSLGDVRLREQGLIIDQAYFPHAVAGEYWTAETFRLYPQSAWAVDFATGLDRADFKSEGKAVRLVRRHANPAPLD